jgi:putative transposase
VTATLDSPRFVYQPPLQVYAQFLDESTYLCSVSSMYADPWRTPPGQGTAPAGPPPGPGPSRAGRHRPGQVFSWDITKLADPVRGTYFDAYVMIDIYSRYIVGAVVHAHESGPFGWGET